MLKLLNESLRPGYPAEYLLSRIRVRMERNWPVIAQSGAEAKVFRDSDSVFSEAEAVERRWLYLQMNHSLREAVAPILLYFEIDNIILCLRFLEADRLESIAAMLDKSLLTHRFKQIIALAQSVEEFAGRLEGLLKERNFEVKGLAEAYRAGGIRQCEEILRKRYLERVAATSLHPGAEDFFRRIIDLRNTMAMAKCVHWKKRAMPVFAAGGYVHVRGALRIPSEEGVATMVRRTIHGSPEAGGGLQPTRLQPYLYAGLTRTLARQMKDGDPVAYCIGYIWNCHVKVLRRRSEFHNMKFAGHFKSDWEKWQ